MPTTEPDIRWVVFDYGEVISRRTAALPELAATLGVTPQRFEEAYWAVRDPYDRGCADLDYWRSVGDQLGVEVDEDVSATLTGIDVAGWLHTDAATLALLAELDESGVPLALLSNAPTTFARTAEQQPWTRHFRTLVFSGDLGIAKPDPAIWRGLVETLGTEPGHCLFLDDRQTNVVGARTAGLWAEAWNDAASIRRRLTELGVLG
ncbi:MULTISPECIES: HAD-IA family hydrolase [Actinoalloteichus]|nr:MULTISPECIES: HAD-IA family hydrolase [Actinoalloteichus]